MLPTFLVIGSARSGTTSIYHYLAQHPEIYMCPIKEVNYFSYEPGDQWVFRAKTREEYERLFDGVTSELAVGDVSGSYMNSTVAAQRIGEMISDVKLIALVRNPADRAFSGYLARVREGTEHGTPEEALILGGRYISGGIYTERLERYYKRFDAEQIKVYLFEDLVGEPDAVYRDLFRFLGVDAEFMPDLSVQHNEGWVPRSQFLNWITRTNPLAKALRPRVSLGLKANIRGKVRRINEGARPVLTRGLRQQLMGLYEQDMAGLEELTGLELSRWRNE